MEKKIKLRLNNDWFIWIDYNGYYVGSCTEGALGIIIQIHSEDNQNLALKIPRLISDYQKENSYISQIIEDEIDIISKISDTLFAGKGLLTAFPLFNKIFKSELIINHNYKDGTEIQKGQYIGLQLKKNKNPRFCSIKKLKDDFQIIPNKLESELHFLSSEFFSNLNKAAKGMLDNWENTVVVNNNNNQKNNLGLDDKGNIIPFNISESLVSDDNEDNWYFGIPSIAYAWGKGTLEDAVQSDKIINWTLKEYLSLLEEILSGVKKLHQKNFLHADIRPANIMYLDDANKPDNYYLIDYAGYNTGKNPIYKGTDQSEFNNSGLTKLGSSVGRERNSPFYSPERRIALEKEDADIAIFMKDVKYIRIFLGWKKIFSSNKELKDELQEEIKKCKIDNKNVTSNKFENSEDILQKGDRIQIREYIFDIVGVGKTKFGRILFCKLDQWKIFQSQIVIRNFSPFFEKNQTITFFTISRYIELKQWSLSSDFYSIGALFQYLILNRKLNSSNKDIGVSISDFQRLLIEFESINFFQEIWQDISFLLKNLNNIDIKKTKNELENIKVDLKDMRLKLINKKHAGYQINLIEHVFDITHLIISTINGTDKLLENLNNNCIYFIYSIGFILFCIHKKTAIILNDEEIYDNIYLPFVENRTINPGEQKNMASDIALEFLAKFKEKIIGKVFDDFDVKKLNLQDDKSSKTPLLLTLENRNLNDENTELKNKIEKFNKNEKNFNKTKNKIDKINRSNEKYKTMAEDIFGEVLKLKGSFFANNKVKSEIKNKIEEIRSFKKGLKN